MAEAEANLIQLTTEVAANYVANNSVKPEELPGLIRSIHDALKNVDAPVEQPAARPAPAVPIKKSVTPDHLISLFDGRKFKSLRRYLFTKHGMTPDQYREHWGLPRDYPMVAPNYAAQRSELAKNIGLGQSSRKAATNPAPAKRGRKAEG